MAYQSNYQCPHCLDVNYVRLVPVTALESPVCPTLTSSATSSGNFEHCDNCQINFQDNSHYP